MTVYGYVRVSTIEQNVESQKNSISRYCVDNKLIIDEWLELEISSRKTTAERRIDELLEKLKEGDIVIVSELSRLGRSLRETLDTVESIMQKRSRLVLIKQNLDLNALNQKDVVSKVMITMLSLFNELERDFLSERTKAGLMAAIAKGKKVGKPKGTLQVTQYDKDHEKILHLYNLGVPRIQILKTHLGYGSDSSLQRYIKKRLQNPDVAAKTKRTTKNRGYNAQGRIH